MLNKKQLCELYKISRPTLNKWLKMIGLYTKGRSLFTPQQLQKMFEIWGVPE
jgi:predicted site-specific integrase-resolvase